MKNENSQPPLNAGSVFSGTAASPGIAIGVCLFTEPSRQNDLLQQKLSHLIDSKDIASERERFMKAVEHTRTELLELRKNVEQKLDNGNASIFDAHLMIVDDKSLVRDVTEKIGRELFPAEFAFSTVIQHYIGAIASVQDQYLKERAADISDVAVRILEHLSGETRQRLDHLPGRRIIISHDLSPSDTAMLDSENVQAIITETGSRTSHSAILARSMKIPAVVGVQGIANIVHSGDMVIVDGNTGLVIVDPPQMVLEEYARKEASNERLFDELLRENQLRPETIDGYRVELAANIDTAPDVSDVAKYGAAGIGLFRTEYLYINAPEPPGEEDQFNTYREVVQAVKDQPVIIRTLDLGGDKLPSLMQFGKEANPFLGMRSVRLCLAHPELLIPQLRAILRASVYGEIRMMFPMITCMDELEHLLDMVEKVKQDLTKEKIKFDPDIKIGMMMETPAAAMFPERFASKCDFFSIGTNDLVQYTMAVDRGNEKVAGLYRPLHPVILQLIRNIVLAARKAGIWVSVCGELAADLKAIPLLIGLGVQELSMSPVSIGMARRVIRRMKFFEAEQLAMESLKCSSHTEIEAKAMDLLSRIAPDVCSPDNNNNHF